MGIVILLLNKQNLVLQYELTTAYLTLTKLSIKGLLYNSF